MDTRSKILSAAEAPRGAVVVAGVFDVLRVDHLRQLRQIRDADPGRPLIAAILPHAGAVLSAESRARMAAALRMVDYVFIAKTPEIGAIQETLNAAVLVRLREPRIEVVRHAG